MEINYLFNKSTLIANYLLFFLVYTSNQKKEIYIYLYFFY